jgi:hypothetical protein
LGNLPGTAMEAGDLRNRNIELRSTLVQKQ